MDNIQIFMERTNVHNFTLKRQNEQKFPIEKQQQACYTKGGGGGRGGMKGAREFPVFGKSRLSYLITSDNSSGNNCIISSLCFVQDRAAHFTFTGQS